MHSNIITPYLITKMSILLWITIDEFLGVYQQVDSQRVHNVNRKMQINFFCLHEWHKHYPLAL